ncbi:MAG TPA: prepilin peptidase [Candidatus Dormibacteraeota bacterium]|nr:prepilin peptidase [Candidatus Dormibacteraeota bacterium]
MNHLLFALGWAVVGGAVGAGLNYLTRWLARIEEIEFRQSLPEMLLMPALTAGLFFLFALQLGLERLLFVDSILVAILVQVLAFDLKTRYILDLVMFPSWVIALALAFVTPWTPYLTWPWPDWRTAPVAALIAGAVFLLLYVGGQLIFGAEAFGFGDVKLAVFIGMATGLSNLRVAHALLYGVFLGGFVAIILLITRIRGLREAVPYGPFLVLGTVLVLYSQAP